MKDISRAIDTAIDFEKKGHDLYMKAASKTSNKLGRITLEAIAAKELDHIKAIENFRSAINASKPDVDKAIGLINMKDKKEYILPIMENLRSELDENTEKDIELEAAYKTAMGLEKDSYDLYKKLASESESPDAKKFFEFLMGEENTHFELLQDTLQYLTHPGDWFAEQERWVVEG